MKKALLTGLSIALIAVVAVFGTLAYFTDTASKTNVATLENVSIEQIEQERVDTSKLPTEEGNLVDFTQGKALLPSYYAGSSIPWNAESEANQAWKVVEDTDNVIDKFITVKNTGNVDAYVRTIIAYEGDPISGTDIHIVTNTTNVDPQIAAEYIENVTINGARYDIAVYTYPEALAAGETTIPSLKQVYMDKSCENDVVEKYGSTYDILVFSQAVQANMNGLTAAEALDEAFGKITATSNPWVGNSASVVVATAADAAELNHVIANADGQDVVVTLTDEIFLDTINTKDCGDVTIIGNGNVIHTSANYGVLLEGANDVTIIDANISMDKAGTYQAYSAGVKVNNGDYEGTTLTLSDCTVTMVNNDWAYAINMPASVKNLNVVIDGCTLEGAIAFQCWGDNNNISITNSTLICNYVEKSNTYTGSCVRLGYDSSNVAENNTVAIDGCTFLFTGEAKSCYAVVGKAESGNTVTITNCTYGKGVTQGYSE